MKHWDGPIAVVAGDEEARRVVSWLKADNRMDRVDVIHWEAKGKGTKGGQQYNKTLLPDVSPFDNTVFLDTDTLVVGDFTDLFPAENTEQIRITRFADWITTGKKVRKRILGWADVLPSEARLMTRVSYPAINTGTMGWTKKSTKFVKEWQEKTAVHKKFMCDEIVCQLIFYRYPHCVLDDRWNASPPYSYSRLKKTGKLSDVRIWHGHGWKFIKNKNGRKVWMPHYHAAVEDNFGTLAEWAPHHDTKLKKLLENPKAFD
jgi:hypothetical protein